MSQTAQQGILQHRAGDAEGEGEDLFAFLAKETTSPETGTDNILGELTDILPILI